MASTSELNLISRRSIKESTSFDFSGQVVDLRFIAVTKIAVHGLIVNFRPFVINKVWVRVLNTRSLGRIGRGRVHGRSEEFNTPWVGLVFDPIFRDPQDPTQDLNLLHWASLTEPPAHLDVKALGELGFIEVEISTEAHASKVVAMNDAMKSACRMMKATWGARPLDKTHVDQSFGVARLPNLAGIPSAVDATDLFCDQLGWKPKLFGDGHVHFTLWDSIEVRLLNVHKGQTEGFPILGAGRGMHRKESFLSV